MKAIGKSLGFLLLFLSLSIPGCEDTVNVNLPQESIRGIQVTGVGSVYGKPDVAILKMGVSVERKSVKEATEEAAEAMRRVIDSLKKDGVVDEDIQTQRFSIQPQYDYVDKRPVLRGYRVTNMVTVKIRDMESIGGIIDDAVDAGGDSMRIDSIAFSIDDPTELQAEARVKAMKDARAKAEVLAREGGVKLGKPISISESIYQPVRDAYYRVAAGEMKTPVEPGLLEIRVTVSVIYSIEEE
jgi:hypothetical protein